MAKKSLDTLYEEYTDASFDEKVKVKKFILDNIDKYKASHDLLPYVFIDDNGCKLLEAFYTSYGVELIKDGKPVNISHEDKSDIMHLLAHIKQALG